MKIIELQAENVKRLKAVDITPDGTLQIIGGRNAQGKSAVLDSIWLALGGGKASKDTPLPIRDGEEKASVTLDLGELVVTRSWTQKGTQLKVANADGATYSSPQKMLDELVGRLSFDPLEFTRLSAKEQRETLLGLVKLDVDLDALADQRNQVFAERAEIGRRGKAIGDVVVDDELPSDEHSAGEIITQIREAEAHNKVIDDALWQVQVTSEAIAKAEAQIAELEEQVAVWREELVNLKDYAHADKVDVAPLESQLSTVEESNAAIRANNEARKQAALKAKYRRDYEAHTAKIAELDAVKADALKGARFPVDGLSFDDSGVLYQGIPFSQASSAEQIRVSMAMAMAMNPKLHVLRIKDGSLLDDDSLTAIRDQVSANDYQLWIERVGNSDEGAVIIEDGEVA